MIDNFVGLTGSNRTDVTNVFKKIINSTNAKTDQENIQINIIIGDNIYDNCKQLEKMGSKEILITEKIDKEQIENKIGIRLLTKKDIDYVIKKYRNDRYE